MKSFAAFILLSTLALAGLSGYLFLRPSAQATSSVSAASPESAGVQARSGGLRSLFEIDPGQSEARFVTNEILRGAPHQVVGTTNQVSGQIELNPADPNHVEVTPIQINARTLATDDSQRNRMIQRFILGTDRHEFITFTPTLIHGLPDTAILGQGYPLSIKGQLTIRDVTRDVVFDATVVPQAEAVIVGSAATTIDYSDWGVSIPSVPFVASVDPQVRLELSFVALAV